MTETMTVETPEVETVETPKQGALKRFAKAFAAKVSKTAQAVKAFFVRLLGDNEHSIREDEGLGRKFARLLSAIPKWLALVPLFLVKVIGFIALMVMVAVATIVSAVVWAIVGLTTLLALTVLKVLQGIALIVRTPYLLVVSIDAFKCDWEGYLLGWTPRYFLCTTIAQVHGLRALRQKAKAEAEQQDLHDVTVTVGEPQPAFEPAPETKVELVAHQGGKGHPTPKQRKRRPARVPAVAVANA